MADILLHICCAPDATVGLERFGKMGDVLGVFINPNIEPYPEYRIREFETRRLAAILNIEYLALKPDTKGWLEVVRGWECEPERGERCRRCITFNLEAAAQQARKMHISHFATSLTISPHKDVAFIHEAGRRIAREFGLTYLDETLRRAGGFQRSLELSRKYGIYRQRYCGCRWSLAEYYRKEGINPVEAGFTVLSDLA